MSRRNNEDHIETKTNPLTEEVGIMKIISKQRPIL